MEPIDLKHKYVRQKPLSRKSRTRGLPFTSVAIAGALLTGLTVFTLLPSERASASRQVQTLSLPALVEVELALEEGPAELPEAVQLTRIEESVGNGDNLSTLFRRAGLTDAAMFELINSSKEAKALAKLYPGHKFVFEVNGAGKLIRLEHALNRLTSRTYTRVGETFEFNERVLKPDVKYALRSGEIQSSLYNAGIDAKLDEQLIMEMAAIFGWDIDFALDIRAGDRFKILFEETFLDGERIGVGHVLAAEFVNQGNLFRAVRYVDNEGKAQYYAPDGKAMQKAFLRAPLDFRRISSNFNPKRLHPISKTVRPHRGTDYAASTGTPVWASGDGKVIASGYTKANGNYIVIQHGGEIQTKYLHLHTRSVKKGDRVKQKQTIGSVGSTGFSTAPHLHYEFLLNGVHRNPRTIIQKLPKAESISDAEQPRFFSQIQPILAELEQSTRYALAEKTSDANL